MPSIYLGMDARIRIEDYAFNNVKDVTLNLSGATADVATRNNSGWRATVRTLKEASVTFQMILPSNANQYDKQIITSFISNVNNTLGMAVMDSEHGNGIIGEWSVTSCNRSENLEDAVTYDVELSLTKFYCWCEKGVSPSVFVPQEYVIRVTSILGASYYLSWLS